MEISTSTAAATCCPKASAETRSVQMAQTQLAAITSSQSIDLELMTNEGDKVTLSIDARSSALYAAFKEVTAEGEDALQAQWGEFSAGQYEREVALTVQGDLNAAERREIRKVIKTINKMMKNFVEGKLNPMMAKTGKLQGLQTIDNLEVSMAYERQVVVAQQTRTSISYDQYGVATSGDQIKATGLQLPLNDESKTLATDMAREVISAEAPVDRLLTMADDLLKSYRDQAARQNFLSGRIMENIRNLFNAAAGNLDHPRGQNLETVDAVDQAV